MFEYLRLNIFDIDYILRHRSIKHGCKNGRSHRQKQLMTADCDLIRFTTENEFTICPMTVDQQLMSPRLQTHTRSLPFFKMSHLFECESFENVQ